MIAEAIFGRLFANVHTVESVFGPEGRSALSNFWYNPVGALVSSGVTVDENTAMTYSAVWAATRLLSATSAWLPLPLYQRTSDGEGREIARERDEHWLMTRRPNDEMTAMLFRSTQVAQQINAGNCYAEIERSGNTPIALHPIHWTRVRPLRDEDDQIVYEIRSNSGENDFIPFRDMLHVPSMITDDGIVGKGVIRHARESIGFGLATEKHGANWFGGGGIPRIAVKHPMRLSDDARKSFRKEWQEIYGGADGQKVALLQEGADVVNLNVSQEDSQFLQTRQHNVEEIARWYGVPPHMLQDLRRGTFSNIEVQGVEFVIYSLMPWLAIWEQVLAFKLLSEQEQRELFWEHNVTALLRGDSKARADFYRTLVTLGVLNRNEVRKFENMNPVEGGDVFLIQGAMTPINEDGTVGNPAAEPAEPVGEVPQVPENGAPQPENGQDTEAIAKVMDALNREMEISNASASILSKTSAQVGIAIDKLDALPKRMAQASVTVGNERFMDGAKAASRKILVDALSGQISHEAKAINQAAKSPGKFLSRLDKFYADHERRLAKSLATSCELFGELGVELDADGLAADIAKRSREHLLELSGTVTAGGLRERVEAEMADWKTNRAAGLVASILGD